MASTTSPAANGPDAKAETEQSLGATTADDAAVGGESEPAEVPQDAPVEEAEEHDETVVPAEEGAAEVPESKKWPGWPGFSVFRMVVPVLKVGSIIGKKGELIKKMCEDTRAKIRILEGAIGTTERIVLVTGKEEPDADISPAMHGVIRVFKRITGIPENEGDGSALVGQPACSVRLLAASSQAISLIGKGGAVIKSIQEDSSATVRVLQGEELPFYATSDERIVDIQGEPLKVLRALELVVGQLRRFLVDQSVIPLFEKTLSSSTPSMTQDRTAEKTQSSVHGTTHTGITSDYPPLKRDYFDRESHLDTHVQRTGLSLYGQDPALAGPRSTLLGRSTGALVTQITQTMQIPLTYAEDIIGIGGANIAYIRRSSGAIITVQESRGLPDEITVEIKGTSTQVQAAQQLIQDFLAGHKEPTSSGYGSLDSSYMSSYSQLGNASYSSSSLPSSHYGSSGGLGGYGGYRY